ncbi:MAG TPA: acyl-CoA dehydrogenase family protein [Gaiellaceae bacterium]|jgi:long-chain-acyl-CoA dehydrogenase|nr:acyl-CoA dehydrogenase family protein [Gaiellaceae bacterium]
MKRDVYSADHDLFRESIQAFIRSSVEPNLERYRAQGHTDRALWRAAGAEDLLGLSVPVELGGSEVDFRFNAILVEELARVALALASSIGIQTDVVAPYLIELSTDDLKARCFPAFCTGELVTAIAMTEPGAGSDLSGIQTRAVQTGSDWVLNGSKTFITNGANADLVIVAARTGEEKREITMFAVSSALPGFSRGRKLEKIGQHEVDTVELFFDDVRLTDADVLGEVGAGFRHMMERLPQERLHVACVNLAQAGAILEATLDYVKERRAFGRSIGSFQHSRFLLAELTTELEITQTYVDRCLAEHVAGNLTGVDAAKAKWWSSDVQNRVLDACVQLHGGYGYMLEYPVARAWADGRVTKIWGGSNEIMKELVGRSLGLRDE